MSKGRLEGKSAIVTGAGSGVGYAVTKLFAAEGAQVAAVVRRDEYVEKLRNVANVLPVKADINKPDEIERMVKETEDAFGKIDILCNIAGIHDRLNPLEETDDALWDSVLTTDLRAPFQICRRVIGGMVARRSGVILNYGSLASLRGLHGPSYCAAKAGLIGLTASIAVGYAKQGIRCNIINSGGVRTEISEHSGGLHERGLQLFKDCAETLPVNWVCTPEEAAPTVLFLCSDESKHVNGAIVALDGGMSVC